MQCQIKFQILTVQLEELSFLHQKIIVLEIFREQQHLIAQKIENVTEHSAIAINEVMLLQGVKNNGHVAGKHPAQFRLRIPGIVVQKCFKH